MEQNIQPYENNVEIKSDSESEPIIPKSEKKINKKIVFLIIIILVIIGFGAVYFLFLDKEDNSQLSSDENIEVVKDEEVTETEVGRELDSDRDGLPDCMEKILGTDENNSDTDGDGYGDFDEIKNGYNPLTNEKFTEEELELVREKIKIEDEGLYKSIFIMENIEEGNIENNEEINITDSENIDEIITENNEEVEQNTFICGVTTIKDVDGNGYNTVSIGDQCWMKENLKVTKDPQGNDITRYCYDNDPNICDTDGGLYDWNTAMNDSTQEGAQGICPNSWHVPKDLEWYELENYLKDGENSCDSMRNEDGCDSAGKKLKIGEISGFNGILSGYRSANTDMFNARDIITLLWSSTMEGDDRAWQRTLSLSHSTVHRTINRKVHSCPIRCLKD